MLQWIKTLAASACILTILLHLIPENRFAKYVRFYAGLLFFLIAAGPLLELLESTDELDRLLQLEFLKEDYYDVESAAEGLSELKSARIQEAFWAELKRQASEIVSAYGLSAVSVQMEFGEDGYSIDSVILMVKADDTSDTDEALYLAKCELAGLYQIPLTDVEISVQT